MTPTKQYNKELYHYGVKGMKWGVRRSIGAKARVAAIYESSSKDLGKSISKYEARKAKAGLTDRQQKRFDKIKKSKVEVDKYRNKLIKDLSEKDIAKGRRAITSSVVLFGGPAAGIMSLGDMRKVKLDEQRERNH